MDGIGRKQFTLIVIGRKTPFTAAGGRQLSSVTVSGGGAVEIATASSSTNATFASNTGTRKLDDSQHYAGTVAGLVGQDALDLADITFTNGTTTDLDERHGADGTARDDGTHQTNISAPRQPKASIGTTVHDPQVASGRDEWFILNIRYSTDTPRSSAAHQAHQRQGATGYQADTKQCYPPHHQAWPRHPNFQVDGGEIRGPLEPYARRCSVDARKSVEDAHPHAGCGTSIGRSRCPTLPRAGRGGGARGASLSGTVAGDRLRSDRRWRC
jgi:hypothetical protein